MKAKVFPFFATLFLGTAATGWAICPGDGTNSAVVGEYLFTVAVKASRAEVSGLASRRESRQSLKHSRLVVL
jgi:hypothetical protein